MFDGIAFEQIYTPPCTEGEFTFEEKVKEISKRNETLTGENGAVYTKRRVILRLQYSDKYQIIEQSQAYTGKYQIIEQSQAFTDKLIVY